MMAAEEIMHFRDARLSQRHRLYGRDCPMVDIDFLVAEFHHCEPVGLCEYKHRSPYGISVVRETASIKTIRNLANRASLPAWVAFYDPATWVYKVVPLNELAEQIWGKTHHMTEADYVTKLYELRGYDSPPASVLTHLNRTWNPIPGLPMQRPFIRTIFPRPMRPAV